MKNHKVIVVGKLVFALTMPPRLVMERLRHKCQAQRSKLHENQQREMRAAQIFKFFEKKILFKRRKPNFQP